MKNIHIDNSKRWVINIILTMVIVPLILATLAVKMYDMDIKAAVGAIIGGAIGACYGLGFHTIISRK